MEKKKSTQIMDGTVAKVHSGYSIVVVSSFKKHPKYGKYFLRTRRYKAVDTNTERREGERVSIAPGRPVSKDKRFRVLDNKKQ